MPKVNLQGAPYIRVANWDVKESVDWQKLCNRLFTVISAATDKTTIVVEGTMLLECETLVKLATDFICIEIDKWECFERRRLSDGKRQKHLPYMLEMWRLHCERFRRALQTLSRSTEFMFLNQIELRKILDSAGQDRGDRSLCDWLSDVATFDATDFVFLISNDDEEQWFQPDEFQRRIFIAPEHKLLGDALVQAMPTDFVLRAQLKTLFAIYLGVALGDASGAPFEFHHGKPVLWNDGQLTVPLIISGRGGVRGAPAGAVTDDFQMTLLALKTLIKNNMRFDSTAHIEAYIDWASKRPGGIGKNTVALFQHDPTVSKQLMLQKYIIAFNKRHEHLLGCSMSNGTLMRASAFVAIPSLSEAIAAAVGDALVSNSNVVNAFANAIYVFILHQIVYMARTIETLSTWLDRKTIEDIYNEYIATNTDIRLRSELAANEVIVAVLDALNSPDCETARKELNMPECELKNLINDKDQKGYVLVALWVALRYTVRATTHKWSFGTAIRNVVQLGGDTDTNAAITGALLATSRVRTTLSTKSVDTCLDVLCETEASNLATLLNVPYRFSTLRIVDGLYPARLGEELALLPAAWTKFFAKPDDNVGSIADPLPVATSSSVATTSTSTSTTATKKRSNDDDDNDDDAVDAVEDDDGRQQHRAATKRHKTK